MTEPLVFRDLAYVLAAAVLGGGLAWLTRQPLILGYVLGGIVVSPLLEAYREHQEDDAPPWQHRS